MGKKKKPQQAGSPPQYVFLGNILSQALLIKNGYEGCNHRVTAQQQAFYVRGRRQLMLKPSPSLARPGP